VLIEVSAGTSVKFFLAGTGVMKSESEKGRGVGGSVADGVAATGSSQVGA
jgi:hypothetical protein